jgi:hypothetical protein
MSEQPKAISAEEFDRLFDDGETDVLQYFDTEHAWHPNRQRETVAIDLPAPTLDALQNEAASRGASVSGLVESWIAQRLGQAAA